MPVSGRSGNNIPFRTLSESPEPGAIDHLQMRVGNTNLFADLQGWEVASAW